MFSVPVVHYGDQTRDVADWVYDWANDVGRPTQNELHELLTDHGLALRPVAPGQVSNESGPVLDSLTGMLAPQHYRAGSVAWLNHRGALGRTFLEDVLARAGTRFVWNATADLAMTHRFMRTDLAARCRVVPLPVRTDIFRPAEGEAYGPQIPAGEDPYRGRPVILYMGRLDTEKRIDHLIWFTKLVVEQVHDALVVATGWFATSEPGLREAAYLHGLVRRLGLRSHVRFIGLVAARERVAELFRRASVSVNFTVNHDEAYGLAQIESAACGTPVVGVGWGGLIDTIHEPSGYQAATLVTNHGTFVDLHDAAREVAALLRSPDALEERSRWAAEWGAGFTWDSYIGAIRDLFAERENAATSVAVEASSMSGYLAEVMSPALRTRWEPARNVQLDSLTVDQYLEIRNRRHLDAGDVKTLSLFDDLDRFRREHYQFVMQDYGTTTPEQVIGDMDVTSKLRPVAFDVEAAADSLRANDLVFGERVIGASADQLALWQRIVDNPNTTVHDVAGALGRRPAQVMSDLRPLIDGGLVIAARLRP